MVLGRLLGARAEGAALLPPLLGALADGLLCVRADGLAEGVRVVGARFADGVRLAGVRETAPD